MRNGELQSQAGTMGRIAASESAKANGASAELESIESFKLTNPASPIPKPPPLYFNPQNSGPPTMKKTQRPVSVTIGEYGVFNGSRKQPAKFDFITKSNNYDTISNSSSGSDDVSSMLRDELEKTLSRSNLKKMNENESNGVHVNGGLNGVHMNGNQTNGAVGYTNGNHNGQTIPNKLNLQKTHSANMEKLSSILSQHHIRSEERELQNNNGGNRVTISIPATMNGKPELRKTESVPSPNGILKTSVTNIRNSANGSIGNGFTEQKNIKFVTDN